MADGAIESETAGKLGLNCLNFLRL